MLSENEAIERMHDLIHTCEVGMKKNSQYDDLFEKDKQAIETVLNLIARLKKENEEYKKLYEKALSDVVSSNKENTELKKQIDLMMNFMYEVWCKYPGSFSHELRKVGFNDSECGTCENKNKNCIDCIKQYFENKAKGEDVNERN